GGKLHRIGQSPESHRPVVARGERTSTIGRNIERRYVIGMLQHELTIFCPGRKIPLRAAIVATGRDKFLAVRCEPHRGNGTVVSDKLALKGPPRRTGLASPRFFHPPFAQMAAIVSAHQAVTRW